MGAELHANPAAGAFGGAPYVATNRVRGAPQWGRNCMRTVPVRHAADIRMGPRTMKRAGGRAEMMVEPQANSAVVAFGGAPYGAVVRVAACEPCHCGLRWSSLWGHEA
eukprot:1884949-Pyramimonas_sp.AAC.1